MSRLFERLVEKRGFSEGFLDPKYEEVGKGGDLPGVGAAVRRIQEAVKRGEKVLIYGDYDADGVTASVVMHDALKLAGVKEVEIMLPNRFTDGYGMSKKCVQFAKEQGVGLVVTVDCGSNNGEVVKELGEIGVDVVITDHHEVLGELPEAVVVVNPKKKVHKSGKKQDFDEKLSKKFVQNKEGETEQISCLKSDNGGGKIEQIICSKDDEKNSEKIEQKNCSEEGECPENMKDLAGVGVAFMVAREMVKQGMIPAGQEKWMLDLVAIGTVCDNMRMRGENRRLCYWGMKVLEKTRRVGLKELLRTAGVKEINTETIGFVIGPRINAAGRMQSAELALKLLMTTSGVEAARLAEELENLNRERKAVQKAAVKEIEAQGVGEEPVIVVAGEWHEGVLGIIAGRLVEEYRRPVFALGRGETPGMVSGGGVLERSGGILEGVGVLGGSVPSKGGISEAVLNGGGLGEVEILKGSGRSFGDFNLAEALTECKDYIIGGGGHAGACGVKVEATGVEEFRRAVNDYYKSLGLKGQERYLEEKEDLTVRRLGGLTLELVEELGRLEPYGEGNAEPVFLLNEVEVVETARLGKEANHLRLTVQGEDGVAMKLMGFFAPEEWLRVRGGAVVNVWMRLMANEFRGVRSVEGRILRLERG